MKKKGKKWLKRFLGIVIALIVVNMLLPSKIQNPVEGCGKESYNPQSFWHPWGDHNHRGVDIFAKKGTVIHPNLNIILNNKTKFYFCIQNLFK